MRAMMGLAAKSFILVIAAPVAAGPLSANEYRSREVTPEFQQEHPCPSTGLMTGACSGYLRIRCRADATMRMGPQGRKGGVVVPVIDRLISLNFFCAVNRMIT